MTPPPISREGFARCPSCLTHVAVAREVSSTICPFCGGSFAAPSAGGARAASSALVAALGLGLALSGCGLGDASAEGEPAVPRDPVDAPPTLQPAVYGGPPRDDVPAIDTPADTDDAADTDAAVDPPVAPSPPPAPKPPEVAPAPAPPPKPVYGGPPRREPPPAPRPPDKGADTSSTDPVVVPRVDPLPARPVEVVPLYGVAPVPERRQR